MCERETVCMCVRKRVCVIEIVCERRQEQRSERERKRERKLRERVKERKEVSVREREGKIE
jgi:hypothetical protein